MSGAPKHLSAPRHFPGPSPVSLSIGILAFPMAHPVWGGIPWSVYRLTDALAAHFPEDMFHLVFYDEPSNDVSKRNLGRLLRTHRNITRTVLPKGDPAVRWCEKNADVVWGTVSGVLHTERVPQVVTLYDMRMFTRYRESYKNYLMHRAGLAYALKHARVAVAISKSTRAEVLKYYPGQGLERKLDLVYLGVPAGFDDPAGVKPLWPDYVEGEPFITTTYDPLPQKRMDLVKRVAPALDEHGWRLVCMGGHRGPKADRMYKHPRVHYPGFVGDDEFPSIVKASSLFLFMSEYEGFGYPPYEAMALGVPVLYNSRCDALRREVGGMAHSFATDDGLGEALDMLLSSESRRTEHVAEGLNLIKRFSWERAARQYMYLFRLAHDVPEIDLRPGGTPTSLDQVAKGDAPS